MIHQAWDRWGKQTNETAWLEAFQHLVRYQRGVTLDVFDNARQAWVPSGLTAAEMAHAHLQMLVADEARERLAALPPAPTGRTPDATQTKGDMAGTEEGTPSTPPGTNNTNKVERLAFVDEHSGVAGGRRYQSAHGLQHGGVGGGLLRGGFRRTLKFRAIPDEAPTTEGFSVREGIALPNACCKRMQYDYQTFCLAKVHKCWKVCMDKYDIIAAWCWMGDHPLKHTKCTCLYPWGREGVRGCPAGKGELLTGGGDLASGCNRLLMWPHKNFYRSALGMRCVCGTLCVCVCVCVCKHMPGSDYGCTRRKIFLQP